MSTDDFSNRAKAYTEARPGYPDAAVDYIRKLTQRDAVFADVGAGTGKLTVLLARHGYKMYAVEPNADMREQLSVALADYPDVEIIEGSAENTTLPCLCADVVISAQALNWFDIEAYRAECLRIGKSNPLVVTLYNYNPAEAQGLSRYDKSTRALYRKPAIKEFPNPVFFTREKWLLYYSSMAGVPQESDYGYKDYVAELNGVFDRDSVDGLLRLNLTTRVYSERI